MLDLFIVRGDLNKPPPIPPNPPTAAGIAYELAAAGATVYATARSTGAGDCTEAVLGGTLAELAQEVAALGTGTSWVWVSSIDGAVCRFSF